MQTTHGDTLYLKEAIKCISSQRKLEPRSLQSHPLGLDRDPPKHILSRIRGFFKRAFEMVASTLISNSYLIISHGFTFGKEGLSRNEFYDFMRKLSPKESHIQLQNKFGEKSPSLAIVYNWYGEFNRGRNTLSDEMRSGHPADAVNPENSQKARK
ncbi:Histone-lysine N-methyltransferase SETMAR [Oopsacas minuta]|uniref:Histone-lysine N-methyltransferase SETMAR n=1 Tax=Oopsacas minuta TaxID=111878 RepID=A0AAV7JH79_9METZ|nr:Histone-lysine N-methyltransferase SETMAR [Oopsacas minuta]